MSEIKEEVKPIDIKAQADLDRLKDKYKDQKTNKDKETPKVDPEVVNQINPQEIDQELEMLNGIYQQTLKRNKNLILNQHKKNLNHQRKNKSQI